MADPRDYLHLNPFVSNSVPEETFWRPDAEFVDVAVIHRRESDLIERGLQELVRGHSHTTSLLFLVGAAGAGKSHLFGRLRRRLNNGEVFAFAANPPTRPAAIEAWVLQRVLGGMCRRLGRPYSQLRAFLYGLVLSGEQEASHTDVDQLHRYWNGVGPRSQQKFLRTLRGRLLDAGQWDAVLLPVLFDVLDPEKEDAAIRWLSGSSNLSDEQLNILKQGGPNERVLDTLLCLGQLARLAAKPMVLVLDQLDQMQSREQIAEFERLLISLHDSSRGWLVVIGLTRETADIWHQHLSTAFRSRFLVGADARIELDPIVPAEQRALLRVRLSSPSLVQQREVDHVDDELYPMAAKDVDDLTGRGAQHPRHLIGHARERYRTCCAPDSQPPRTPDLQDVLSREFDEAYEKLDPDAMMVDKAVLADRLAELVEVVSAADLRPFARSNGPLEEEPRFRGTDTDLLVGDVHVRLLGHHVQQGRQFPHFLKQVEAVPPPAILVRDAAIVVSGPVTLERLAAFQRDKQYLHLSRPHIAEAYALGDVLAAMREGNFDDVEADPKPTRIEIMRCLGRIERVRQHPVVVAVLELAAHALLDPGAAPGSGPSPSPRAELPTTPESEGRVEARVLVPGPGAASHEAPELLHGPGATSHEARELTPRGRSAHTGLTGGCTPAHASDAGVITAGGSSTGGPGLLSAVESIMRRERWLVLDRLRRELSRTARITVDLEQLRMALSSGPMRTRLTYHPANILEEADIHIVIWAGD